MRKLCIAAALSAIAASSLVGTAESGAPEKRWKVDLRLIAVAPDESGTTSPSVGPGPFDIEVAYVPEVDVEYFFDERWSVELIAATSPHKVSQADVGPLGETWVLPPTLTLKFHPDMDETFKPYIGVGINYTTFWNVDNPPGLDLDYGDSWGWAVQAGVDIQIDDRWSFNIDVKKIDIDTDVRVSTTLGAFVTDAKVEIDPWVIGVGFGYRF